MYPIRCNKRSNFYQSHTSPLSLRHVSVYFPIYDRISLIHIWERSTFQSVRRKSCHLSRTPSTFVSKLINFQQKIEYNSSAALLPLLIPLESSVISWSGHFWPPSAFCRSCHITFPRQTERSAWKRFSSRLYYTPTNIEVKFLGQTTFIAARLI